jgi:outer membrane lipoprotein-sorting protein
VNRKKQLHDKVVEDEKLKPRLGWIALSLLAVALSATARAQTDLQKALAQMDAASAHFKSAQADFQWDDFEAAVQQTDQQSGKIYFEKQHGETRMAAMLLSPLAKQLVYEKGVLQLYEPNIDHLTEFAAGKNAALYESFSTLGFGGKGSDLQANWTVSYQGHEKIDGVDTVKLDLLPKMDNVRNIYSHITLWIDAARDVSLKQQAFEPSGDYRTAHYTNIKLDQAIPESVFVVKTTKKTTVMRK